MFTETQLITIDNYLHLILFGLECALDVEFSVEAVEKLFSDGENDAVSEKRYTLWTGRHLMVTGIVEEYEPQDVLLTIQSVKAFSPSFTAIVERAKYQAYHLEQRQEIEAPDDTDHTAVD